ncbi:MAG: cytochrome C [Geobacteraceae bacterium]|nr:cytochrome C [Geobacteraceae bacterium]NTW79654.1 cytochrome C [Geobacteraceae bacterium]
MKIIYLRMNPYFYLVLLGCLLLTASGCDPVTRHKVVTSVLDGYPALPPVEELCREHEERAKIACLNKTAPDSSLSEQAKGSVHVPYEEKRCNDCHNESKGADGGQKDALLIKPKEELCFVCHKDILDKPFQHGPAAVGDCVACHLPHDSIYPALLNVSKESLCTKCHVERRKAARMHDQFVEKGLTCESCHDPHAGNTYFFLK